MAQTNPGESGLFEKNVQPILRANCQACHNQQSKTSGLALDSRASVVEGGNRGPAAKPGSPAESLLIQAVEQKGDLKMPPGKKLADDQIAVLRSWIEKGMEWSKEAPVQTRRGWDHWSFQTPKHPDPPAVKNAAWVKNPIDRFVLAKLEKENVRPSAEADRYTLLRRVSLDLTGLQPTPKEIQDFVNDKSRNAYEKVVDRLLASPHYGERWARHWLDIARYADSDGYSIDEPRQMWRYRDWVIRSLNHDQPFDRFAIEQLAGDLLPNPTTEQLIATGFHRNTPSNFEGGIDFEQYRNEAVADRVATTGAAFLGLTLGCARCHDHKYDPVTQREFYQFFAYFNNSDEITTEAERPDFNRPMLETPTAEDQRQMAAYLKEFEPLNREIVEYVRTLAAKPAVEGTPKHRDPQLVELTGKLRALRRRAPLVTYTLIMRELPKPRDAYIHLGGDFLRKGSAVSPGTPAFLPAKVEGGNRLDLAKWIVDPRNPLTARVTVNRMWQMYFGKGIVESENDFGLIGAKPTHPELLDWLATEFVARGWSQKAMHRLIVTSAVYRQDSKQRQDLEEIDPYNYLLARQVRLRVEAEIMRDSALVASGMLNPSIEGPSVFPPIPPGAMTGTQVQKVWPTSFGPDRYRRGVYTFVFRSAMHPALGLIDAPDGMQACTRRVRSDSPLQALTLLNDTAFIEFARGLGKRIVAEGGATDRSRLEFAVLNALGRKPSQTEVDRLTRLLSVQRDEFQTDPESAKVLIGGGGDVRAMREAEATGAKPPAGTQSPRGRIVSERTQELAQLELAAGKVALQKRTAEIAAMDAKAIRELAVWTEVSRVLFNLDDFITRN